LTLADNLSEKMNNISKIIQGTKRISLEWLNKNYDKLKESNPICLYRKVKKKTEEKTRKFGS